MNSDIWQKQDSNKPLFEDLIWSKPSTKMTAGKLLIIGGNSNGFTSPAICYTKSLQAGAGTVKVLMPQVLQKVVGKTLEDAEFAPNNNSGSFSKQAISAFLDLANWSDGVLLAGDFSNNSETATLLETFLEKYSGQITFYGDAVDLALNNPHAVLNRINTLLVLDFSKLQKLFINSRFARPLKSTMNLDSYIETVSEYTKRFKPIILSEFNGNIVVSEQGKVITTKTEPEISLYPAKAAVWWMQHPSKSLPAIASAIVN